MIRVATQQHGSLTSGRRLGPAEAFSHAGGLRSSPVAFESALARSPSTGEREALLPYVKAQHAYFTSDAEAANNFASPHRPAAVDAATSAAWTALARVLLNVDEFITRE